MAATIADGQPVRISLVDIEGAAVSKMQPPSSKYECVIIPNTFLMNLNALPQLILAHTPKRKRAELNFVGNGIVALGISQSDCLAAQANASGEYTGNVAYVDASKITAPIEIKGTTELWAALVSAGTNGTAQTELLPANPAAGSDFTYTNNTGVPQSLISIAGTLTTDAVVATRFVNVQIRDASGFIIGQQTDFSGVVASTSVAFWYAQGMPNTSNNAAGTTLGGLPNILVQPNWTVRIHVVAMDAGDQLSAIGLVLTSNAIQTAISVLKEIEQ